MQDNWARFTLAGKFCTNTFSWAAGGMVGRATGANGAGPPVGMAVREGEGL